MKERPKKLILTLLLKYDSYMVRINTSNVPKLFGNEFLEKVIYISPHNKQFECGCHFYFIFNNFTFFVECKKDEINIFEEHESKRCLMIENYNAL